MSSFPRRQIRFDAFHDPLLRLIYSKAQGYENLVSRILRLATLAPMAVSITWGAGGSTKDRSLELAGMMQQEYGLETVMHLTCTNMEQGSIDQALAVRAVFLGIYLPLTRCSR